MKDKYYYSQSTKGFYCDSVHGKKKPKDCIEITQQKHQELLSKNSKQEIVIENDKAILKNRIFSNKELETIVDLKIQKKLDSLGLELAHNETYQGTESYEQRKNNTLNDLMHYRVMINDLDYIIEHIEKLQEITAEELSEKYRKLKEKKEL